MDDRGEDGRKQTKGGSGTTSTEVANRRDLSTLPYVGVEIETFKENGD